MYIQILLFYTKLMVSAPCVKKEGRGSEKVERKEEGGKSIGP
jgi:hypothetical protein